MAGWVASFRHSRDGSRWFGFFGLERPRCGPGADRVLPLPHSNNGFYRARGHQKSGRIIGRGFRRPQGCAARGPGWLAWPGLTIIEAAGQVGPCQRRRHLTDLRAVSGRGRWPWRICTWSRRNGCGDRWPTALNPGSRRISTTASLIVVAMRSRTRRLPDFASRRPIVRAGTRGFSIRQPTSSMRR
jgi:hypothetical protein